MIRGEPISVAAPEGVVFADGPNGPRASDGKEYRAYRFAMFDVQAEEINTAKKKLSNYYQRFFNSFCFSFSVKRIEWRMYPSITVSKAKSKKKNLFDVCVYSRFYSPEASTQQEQIIRAFLHEPLQ